MTKNVKSNDNNTGNYLNKTEAKEKKIFHRHTQIFMTADVKEKKKIKKNFHRQTHNFKAAQVTQTKLPHQSTLLNLRTFQPEKSIKRRQHKYQPGTWCASGRSQRHVPIITLNVDARIYLILALSLIFRPLLILEIHI